MLLHANARCSFAAVWPWLAVAMAWLALADTVSAMIYKAPSGTLKDNCVVWHNGTFHLLTMYRERIPGGEELWNNVWLATSSDGVHWKGVGPVIRNAPFIIYAMRAWKVGNRFVLNHGSFTGPNQDVLRFWQSDDLVHWKYLGKEYDVRRPDGGRLDHMDVIATQHDGRAQWYGYACGGLLRSADGVKWKWLEDYRLSDRNWHVGETAGCQQLAGKYYLLGGNWNGMPQSKGLPGDANYAVLTFVADQPAGPFRPDYPAFRLHGNSGSRAVAVWAGYCRLPDQVLLTNYVTDPHGDGMPWWHAPLKKAVVDKDGHLRMGYWPGNDALKGRPVAIRPGNCTQLFPSPAGGGQKANSVVTVKEDVVRVERPAGPSPRWLGYNSPRTALALLKEPFDCRTGFVLEGRMRVDPLGFGRPVIGLYLEQRPQEGTAALWHTCRLTEIGTMRLADDAHFDCDDRTGFGCATVAGIDAQKASSFRLLFRNDMFELYLNDLLVQTYHTDGATGRVGFLVRDGQAVFDNLKCWEMSIGN